MIQHISTFDDDDPSIYLHDPYADQPDALSVAYRRQVENWRLLWDLDGGTNRMRRAGERRLPREPREKEAGYKVRLERSVLYEAFKKTHRRMASMPFAQPVTFNGEFAPELESLRDNMDRMGCDATQFAYNVFADGLFYGFGLMLGEAPDTGGANLNRKAFRELGMGTYLTRVSPKSLLGFDTEINVAGHEVVTEMRIKEDVPVADGAFGQRMAEQIRHIRVPLTDRERDPMEVLAKNLSYKQGAMERSPQEQPSVAIYQRLGIGTKWVLVDEKPYQLRGPYGGIPAFPFYTGYCGTFEARPPLQALAEMNLRHWQIYSDYTNIIRFVGTGILEILGFSGEDLKKSQGFTGPTAIFHSEKTPGEAHIKWVEHTGSGLAKVRDEILDIEKRMMDMSHRMMQREDSAQTATGEVLSSSGDRSELQQYVRNLENSYNDAIWWCHEAMGTQPSENFRARIYDDFEVGVFGDSDMNHVLAMRAAGDIDRRTLIEEAQRRGKIRQEKGIDEIEEALAGEAQNAAKETAAMMGGLYDEDDVIDGDLPATQTSPQESEPVA